MKYPTELWGLEMHEWGLIVAGVCVGFSCLFSVWGIFMHLRRYVNPQLQRAAVRLTLMIPVILTFDNFNGEFATKHIHHTR